MQRLHVAPAAAGHLKNLASGVVNGKNHAALEVLKGKCKPAILCQLYFAQAKSHLKESFQTYISAGTSLPVSCNVHCHCLSTNVMCLVLFRENNSKFLRNPMLYLF